MYNVFTHCDETTTNDLMSEQELRDQQNAEREALELCWNKMVAMKIAAVESRLRAEGIQYDPSLLWGKYIALRKEES